MNISPTLSLYSNRVLELITQSCNRSGEKEQQQSYPNYLYKFNLTFPTFLEQQRQQLQEEYAKLFKGLLVELFLKELLSTNQITTLGNTSTYNVDNNYFLSPYATTIVNSTTPNQINYSRGCDFQTTCSSSNELKEEKHNLTPLSQSKVNNTTKKQGKTENSCSMPPQRAKSKASNTKQTNDETIKSTEGQAKKNIIHLGHPELPKEKKKRGRPRKMSEEESDNLRSKGIFMSNSYYEKM
ncbi:hypothetical protein ABK040_006884 [Willaertia magna]